MDRSLERDREGARGGAREGRAATEEQPRPDSRPRALLTFVVPLVLAAPIGVLAGLEPLGVLLLGGFAALAVTMVVRLEWAVHVLVAASCFEGYLTELWSGALTALVTLTLASWLVRRAWGPLHGGRRRPVLVCAGVLAGVLLLATLAHANGSPAVAVLGGWAGVLVVLVVIADAVSAGTAPRSIARTYVLACAAATVVALLVLLVTDPDDRRLSGPVSGADELALYLLVAVALTPAVRAGARRTLGWDLVLPLLVLGLLATLSRAALVGAVVVLVVAVGLRVISLRAAAVVVVLAGTVTAISLATTPQSVEVALERNGPAAASSVEERIRLWDAATAMVVADPVLGVGPAGFELYQDDYRDLPPVGADQPNDGVHNTYLEVAAETGLAGLLSWIALLAAGMTSAWSRWREDRTPVAGWVTVALAGAVGTTVFVSAHLALPLWLLLALAAGLDRRPDRLPSRLTTRFPPTTGDAIGGEAYDRRRVREV